jgi:hypothetical protein
MDHDFQELGLVRNISDETRLMAADLANLRLKKLWIRYGKIILNRDELLDLWPGARS